MLLTENLILLYKNQILRLLQMFRLSSYLPLSIILHLHTKNLSVQFFQRLFGKLHRIIFQSHRIDRMRQKIKLSCILKSRSFQIKNLQTSSDISQWMLPHCHIRRLSPVPQTRISDKLPLSDQCISPCMGCHVGPQTVHNQGYCMSMR